MRKRRYSQGSFGLVIRYPLATSDHLGEFLARDVGSPTDLCRQKAEEETGGPDESGKVPAKVPQVDIR